MLPPNHQSTGSHNFIMVLRPRGHDYNVLQVAYEATKGRS